MGRKRKPLKDLKSPRTIRLPNWLWEKIDKEKEKTSTMILSHFIEKILKEYFKRKDKL